ncbi:dihydroneopterin aldolase, partial [Pasteurella multocida subsp. multocida str. Anand1_cattle]
YCLNYAEVSAFILDYVQSKPFLLIERVAYEVAEQLQQRFGIPLVAFKIE